MCVWAQIPNKHTKTNSNMIRMWTFTAVIGIKMFECFTVFFPVFSCSDLPKAKKNGKKIRLCLSRKKTKNDKTLKILSICSWHTHTHILEKRPETKNLPTMALFYELKFQKPCCCCCRFVNHQISKNRRFIRFDSQIINKRFFLSYLIF